MANLVSLEKISLKNHPEIKDKPVRFFRVI